uniref:PIR Superfamily Protein n=1 Tax=Strongyloides papillosus TaxID=174720 RepID=A0A0N5C2B0_STREA
MGSKRTYENYLKGAENEFIKRYSKGYYINDSSINKFISDKYEENLISDTQENNNSLFCFSSGVLYKSNPPIADSKVIMVSTLCSYSYYFTDLFSPSNVQDQDHSIFCKCDSETAALSDSFSPDSSDDLFKSNKFTNKAL